VQLYPANANERLLKFLEDAGAKADTVLPYVYASESDDARVMAVIDEMATGQIDAIAFTSPGSTAPRRRTRFRSRSGAAARSRTHRRCGGWAHCSRRTQRNWSAGERYASGQHVLHEATRTRARSCINSGA
jgi:hypothetical protein